MPLGMMPLSKLVEAGKMSNPPVVQQTVDTKDAAKYLGVSVEFLKRARIKGNGPEFIKMGTRKVVYRITVLDQYLVNNSRRNLCV